MLTASVTIEFKSPCLANSAESATNGGIDAFDRAEDGRPMWHPRCLDAAIRRASQFVSDVPSGTRLIEIEPEFDALVKLHTRTYTRKGKEYERTHEIVPSGVPCDIVVRLSEEYPEQAKEMLVSLGRLVGISPFGHNLGFGRFEIVNFHPNTQ
jgi:hypothetical protein